MKVHKEGLLPRVLAATIGLGGIHGAAHAQVANLAYGIVPPNSKIVNCIPVPKESVIDGAGKRMDSTTLHKVAMRELNASDNMKMGKSLKVFLGELFSIELNNDTHLRIASFNTNSERIARDGFRCRGVDGDESSIPPLAMFEFTDGSFDSTTGRFKDGRWYRVGLAPYKESLAEVSIEDRNTAYTGAVAGESRQAKPADNDKKKEEKPATDEGGWMSSPLVKWGVPFGGGGLVLGGAWLGIRLKRYKVEKARARQLELDQAEAEGFSKGKQQGIPIGGEMFARRLEATVEGLPEKLKLEGRACFDKIGGHIERSRKDFEDAVEDAESAWNSIDEMTPPEERNQKQAALIKANAELYAFEIHLGLAKRIAKPGHQI